MIVHLIDGTYELFRHFYGIRRIGKGDPPFGAVRGVLQMVLQMIENGATHIGVATDHVIESFRNELWDGYKTGAGIDAALWAQFHPLEEALTAMGVAVWPMVELEADDALASAAALAAADPAVEKVCIWTPDKDLAQCVVAERVVQVDRKSGKVRDAAGVREKFGVAPKSIPDYLALVGDAADGYPGLAGFGAKSTAAVLARFEHIEAIPADGAEWHAGVAGSGRLAATLNEQRELALLFRTLATLRSDAELFDDVEHLRWRGPTEFFAAYAKKIDAPELDVRASRAVR
ncbi:MAG TPA: 5'-3' exonuclease H3TH domain-containing protein [Thermoanaerobaculia bacterium]|nr:5'-3' exonuclease H3TH domain-containing protein [Thermoanaerobaculia bacterium]